MDAIFSLEEGGLFQCPDGAIVDTPGSELHDAVAVAAGFFAEGCDQERWAVASFLHGLSNDWSFFEIGVLGLGAFCLRR